MFKENILSRDSTTSNSNQAKILECDKGSIILDKRDEEKNSDDFVGNNNIIDVNSGNFKKETFSCLRNNSKSKNSGNNSKKAVRFTDLPPQIYEYENSDCTNDEPLFNYLNIKNGMFFCENKDNELEAVQGEAYEMEDSITVEGKNDGNSNNNNMSQCSKLLLPILNRREIYEMEREITGELNNGAEFLNIYKTREVVSIDGKYIQKRNKHGSLNLLSNNRSSNSDLSDCENVKDHFKNNLDGPNTIYTGLGSEKYSENGEEKEKYNKNYITLEELSIEINKISKTQNSETYNKHNSANTDPSYIDLQSTTESLNFV
ncbi:hypothetical protein FG386_001796 [Cryptosporidium ryanae]|uniref:uncharacterized protein n=1 Tax=Cryptosporidium ryanae TaxID=515981 RepID=UPI003519EAD6|nr:hypothetical protein FG386_001796 [Cryptosporidium ryanae]